VLIQLSRPIFATCARAVIDKLDKIGPAEVTRQLGELGVAESTSAAILACLGVCSQGSNPHLPPTPSPSLNTPTFGCLGECSEGSAHVHALSMASVHSSHWRVCIVVTQVGSVAELADKVGKDSPAIEEMETLFRLAAAYDVGPGVGGPNLAQYLQFDASVVRGSHGSHSALPSHLHAVHSSH
jgi:hypothetical protein